jgi:hypothetical protein
MIPKLLLDMASRQGEAAGLAYAHGTEFTRCRWDLRDPSTTRAQLAAAW